MKGECIILTFPKSYSVASLQFYQGQAAICMGVDLHRTPCQGGYPNSSWWLRLCSAQPGENCQRQSCRDKGKQVSEDVPEHTPTTTWFSAPMLILKTSYKNYISMVWSMRGLNKYLPKELEALLVLPALPFSHRSLFFLEFESFAFVGYLY